MSAGGLRARTGGVFYGWYVIGVAMVGAFLVGGMTSQVFFSVILKPLTDETGWSRTEVAGAITLGTLAGGLVAPISGMLVDRYGPRYIAPLGAIVVVAALLLMSQMHSLVLFYVSYILARSFGSNMVGGVVSQSLAVNWFRRMRGRAFGLLSMAIPLGGSIGALVAQPLINGPGWRTIFIVFPILMLTLFVVPAAIVYRRRPEDMGLLPDGDPPEAIEESTGRPLRAPEFSWTVREAVRTKALWLIVAGMFIGTLANGSVSFHLVAYYQDKGFSSTTAAAAISLFAFFGAVASIIWGFLVERFSERLLLAFAMVLSGFCMWAMLPNVGAPAALTVAALYGLIARGEGTLVNMVLAQYYGRESYGRIAGVTSPFNMAALGLGPLAASLSYDLTGAYTIVYGTFGFTYMVSAVLLWMARRPARPARDTEPDLVPISV